ncbi:MAG: hypothetical protein AMJ79_15250 [Phycisphaerae bacterium SM23_30]|nr:MAG: hypothetical protein AMJ79_15250 [Phycisphaerae bacterium SM23_30]
MWKNLVIILRMIRFSHTVFALPFALMAAFLAAEGGRGGFCGWGKLFLIIWCMVWARSAAMTFNRIADAEIDTRNPRTAARAIPAGQISKRKAWVFLYICAMFFGAGAYLFWRPLGNTNIVSLTLSGDRPITSIWSWFGYGNYWPAVLAVPILFFICLYSYSKRFTWATHFWLGASLMLAPVGTWIAVSPPAGPVLSAAPVVLGLAVLLWTAGFDIIYAIQDIQVDRREGLYSLPSRWGKQSSLWISRICHSVTVTALLVVAPLAGLGGIYLSAVVATGLILVLEHLLVWRGRVKLAFDINGAVGILLAGAGIGDILI